MERICGVCGAKFTGRADKLYCKEACSKRARRAAGAVVTALPRSPDSPAITGRADAIRAELIEAGRLETTLGQNALALAIRMDADQDAGSALAALSREMRAALAEAVKGAKAQQSSIESYRDELAARRRA